MIDPLAKAPREHIQFDEGDTAFLCEGRDECALIAHLTEKWERRPKVGTRADDAKWGWKEEFRLLATQVPMRRLAALGFVFDAERSAEATERRLTQWYRAAELSKPIRPNTVKTSTVDGVRVRTAYLINPHGEPRGMLESLFLPQIRHSKVWPCVGALMACYAETCPTKQNRTKVVVRTFIAHSNGSNTGLGVAIRDGILKCNRPELDSVRRFVELLR